MSDQGYQTHQNNHFGKVNHKNEKVTKRNKQKSQPQYIQKYKERTKSNSYKVSPKNQKN